jgi:hypothetical protein
MSKSFALSVAAANAEDDVDDAPMPFTIEGSEEQLFAYQPTEGQLVLLVGVMSDFESPQEQASTVLDVFWGLLQDDTAKALKRRLRDRHDTFGLADIMNIIEWIVEETSARPTRPSLASVPSRATNGHLSTGGVQRKARARSTSRPIASTT